MPPRRKNRRQPDPLITVELTGHQATAIHRALIHAAADSTGDSTAAELVYLAELFHADNIDPPPAAPRRNRNRRETS